MPADHLSRRQLLLGTASLATVSGLAGCQGSPASLEPRLPATRLRDAGWRQVADIDEATAEEIEFAGTTREVRVETRAEVYENQRAVERIADRFDVDRGDVAVPGELFVAAKASVDPPVTRLLGVSDAVLERAMDAAEGQAKQQLRDQGFTNVRRVDDGTLDIEAGGTANHRVYRADYPYESFELSYDGHPVTVHSGEITVEAQLAVWPDRGLLVTGAGVYPAEVGRLTVSARGVTRELALELEPERYRRGCRQLITLVS